MSVIGYGRCSTAEQASKGVSIEVQRSAVERVAESNGWDLIWLADEGVSGACRQSREKRFKAGLALLEAGESEALIFTKVDRASRCTEDFARLLRLSEEQGPGTGYTNPKTSARAPWHPVEGLHSMSLRSQGPVNELPGVDSSPSRPNLATAILTAPRPAASLTSSTPSWTRAS
jgi:resolvase-like protein